MRLVHEPSQKHTRCIKAFQTSGFLYDSIKSRTNSPLSRGMKRFIGGVDTCDLIEDIDMEISYL